MVPSQAVVTSASVFTSGRQIAVCCCLQLNHRLRKLGISSWLTNHSSSDDIVQILHFDHIPGYLRPLCDQGSGLLQWLSVVGSKPGRLASRQKYQVRGISGRVKLPFVPLSLESLILNSHGVRPLAQDAMALNWVQQELKSVILFQSLIRYKSVNSSSGITINSI